MLYRKLSFVLTIVLLLGILVSCSNNSTSPSISPSSSESPQSSSASPSEPVAEPSAEPSTEPSPEPSAEPPAPTAEQPEPTAAPELVLNFDEPLSIYDHSGVTYDLPLFPGENVSFSMWVSLTDNMSTFMPNLYYDNKAYQKAAELTGVEIDFRFVTTVANQEQFNLMIAGNDYTDIVTNVAMLWTESYDYAIEEEIFFDLSDMVENYMPAYKSYYDCFDPDVIRDLHTDSGYMPRLLGINYDLPDTSDGLLIRTDYLKQVGMDIPRTYDEIDAVLRAFKTEIGMSQPFMLPKGIVPGNNSLCSGFDVLGTFSTFPMATAPWYQVEGDIKFGVVEPGYKEYIELVSGWFADGLVSPEFMVLNDNPMGSAYQSEITSGNAGIHYGGNRNLRNYLSAGQATNPDFDLAAMPQPVKEIGQVTHFAETKSPISGRLPGIAVTTACKDLGKLGKYLDFFFTEEGALLATVGIEGQAYEIDKDGKLAYPDEWLESPLGMGEKPTFYIYSVIPALYPLKVPAEEQIPAAAAAPAIWDENTDSAYTIPTLSLITTENDVYSKKWVDIQTYLEENLMKFVVGERPMAEWDDFIAQVWSMDLQALIDIYQGALNRYYAR